MGGLLIALRALAVHKVRTGLAMLGIFLGALALTGVLHISNALALKAEQETAKFGPNLVQATAGQLRFRPGGGIGVSRDPVTTFTLDDSAYLINKITAVDSGVPYVAATKTIRAGSANISCSLVASLPGYSQVRSSRAAYGRFLNDQDILNRTKICVLGSAIAERLFKNREAALGRTVYIQQTALTVVGIMEEKGQDVSGTNMDEMVFVPLSTYMRRLANIDWISGVYLNLRQGADIDKVSEDLRIILRARHYIAPGDKDDFFVFSAKEATQMQQQAMDLVWTLGLLSSSVSFAVGALGILSIMILMVRTRRLEIGIRRAVGASRRQIMWQFLAEAGLMSGVGGALGVAAALGLITLAYGLGGLPYVYDFILAAGVCLAAALLGVAAGAYPAWQASRGDILEVLRNAE